MTAATSEEVMDQARRANVAVAAMLSSVLMAARALLADERKWTRKTWARDHRGQPVPATQGAACYCLSGALLCAARSFDLPSWQVDALHGLALEATRRAVFASRSGWPAAWNDAPARTHAEVLAALDSAMLKGPSQ